MTQNKTKQEVERALRKHQQQQPSQKQGHGSSDDDQDALLLFLLRAKAGILHRIGRVFLQVGGRVDGRLDR